MRAGKLLLIAALLAGCASTQKPLPILATVPPGRVTWVGELPVLHLSGSPYEMGYQHGSLLRRQVQASVANAMAFIRGEAGVPVVGGWMAARLLDRSWKRMAPHVPLRIQEEMEGLADGAMVPLATLQRIHALPELMATSCASFAAFGRATKEGRLIQIRNLDWAIQSDVQRYAAIFVHHPAGKRSFVSMGWLGFVGVVSGINDQGISIGEIGAKTVDGGLDGIPMPFLLRRVLEEAQDLKQAVSIVEEGPRTGGYNYLFADAIRKEAVALETTHRHCVVFRADQEGGRNPFAVNVPDAIFRSDWVLDPAVRDLQLASNGDPKRPGLEPPFGSSAYEIRYRGQGLLLDKFRGAVDAEVAMAIARAIAPSSNIQSVVYAYPELWVANASGRRAAAVGRYLHLALSDLFRE
ncbi:MAG: hypothetical protein HYZ93_06855 [Candidatus Omnitrophica bacterium]|nr:hypothetical protein [Candidatus Omnitrophota bacterium]